MHSFFQLLPLLCKAKAEVKKRQQEGSIFFFFSKKTKQLLPSLSEWGRFGICPSLLEAKAREARGKSKG